MKDKAVKLKEKRKKKIDRIRNNHRKRFMIISVTAIILAAGAWLLYTSDFFSIHTIRVEGNRNITDKLVIEKSRIGRNDNLITLPVTKIAKRLASYNWIQKASVLRDWPDGVLIKITERKPLAYLDTEKGIFLVDKKGFVIDKLSDLKIQSEIPKIDGLAFKKIKVGKYIKNKTLKNALDAYYQVDKALRKEIFSITAKSVNELYFVVQGVEIIYGKSEKNKLKNKVIKTILKQKKEEISALDVRIPEKPVIRILGK
ncbi:MAG: FtsQ-type POTRA domain-containing protein [Actinobacteria bacterium]|nr:MAG: FtsQ-type POTRA domain-containing protein [Actinomycetota bacterium]